MDFFPGAEIVESNSRDIVMRSRNDSLSFKFGLKFANIVQDSEEASLGKFQEQAKFFCEPILKLCEVTSLTRMGNRILFRKYCRTKAETQEIAAAVAHHHQIGFRLLENSPENRLSQRKVTSFSLRLDDDSTSVKIELAIGNQTVTVSPEVDRLIPQVTPRIRYFVQLDVDIFTQAAVPVTLFNSVEFMSGNKKLIDNHILPKFDV